VSQSATHADTAGGARACHYPDDAHAAKASPLHGAQVVAAPARTALAITIL
jgi:hypothetical protein